MLCRGKDGSRFGVWANITIKNSVLTILILLVIFVKAEIMFILILNVFGHNIRPSSEQNYLMLPVQTKNNK